MLNTTIICDDEGLSSRDIFFNLSHYFLKLLFVAHLGVTVSRCACCWRAMPTEEMANDLFILRKKTRFICVLPCSFVSCLLIEAIDCEHSSVQMGQTIALQVECKTAPRLLHNAEAGECVRDRPTVKFVHRIGPAHFFVVLLQVVQEDLKHLFLLECYGIVDRSLIGQVAFENVCSEAISKFAS